MFSCGIGSLTSVGSIARSSCIFFPCVWHVGEESEWICFLHRIRWQLHVFRCVWNLQPALPGDRYFVHVKRAFNSDADSPANRVLDLGVPRLHAMNLDFKLQTNEVIFVASDGASRGNPGRASAAANLQVLRHGALVTIAYDAVRLHDTTSVHAEFEAALLGQRLFPNHCLHLGPCS